MTFWYHDHHPGTACWVLYVDRRLFYALQVFGPLFSSQSFETANERGPWSLGCTIERYLVKLVSFLGHPCLHIVDLQLTSFYIYLWTLDTKDTGQGSLSPCVFHMGAGITTTGLDGHCRNWTEESLLPKLPSPKEITRYEHNNIGTCRCPEISIEPGITRYNQV